MSSKSKKPIFIFIVVIILVVVLISIFLLGTRKNKTIKIGAIISLTGSASHLVAIRDGLEFAVGEINELGGVNGHLVELIVRDSKSDPDEAVRMMKELEVEHHPTLYISCLSNVSVALAPLAQAYQVPLAGLVVSLKGFTDLNNWLFRFYYGAKQEAVAASSVVKRVSPENLLIIHIDNIYGASVKEELLKILSLPGKQIETYPYTPNNPDIEYILAQANRFNSVYLVGYSNQVSQIAKALIDSQYRGTVIASSGLLASSEFDGVYVAAPNIYNPNFVFARDVKSRYEEKTGEPFNHYVATSYDFIQLFTGLLEDKELNRDQVREVLSGGFSHNGVFGNFTIEPGERDIYFPLYPALIKNGQYSFPFN